MKRLAVLGQPVAHSRSPAMQSAALEELGLAGEWSYEALELSPGEFAARVRGLEGEGFVGANVTIPHKEAALAAADTASGAARAIGAANTLSFEGGRIHADNTDASGLLAALPRDPAGDRALVLGAGGAARAAAWALRGAGARVRVLNRTAERAEALAEDLGVEAAVPGDGAPPVLVGHGLVVNSTAIGLGGGGGASSPALAGFKAMGFEVDQLTENQVVVDLVYGVAETELIRAARGRGAETVDGLEVLVRQGAESLRIWTGADPPLTTMRRAAREQSD